MIRDELLSVAATLLFLIVLMPLVLVLAHRYRVVGPAIFALMSRQIWGFISHWLYGLEASDSAYYDAAALALVTGEDGVHLVPGKEAWPILLSYIYRLFGHVPELGLVLNAAVAGLLPVVMVLICRAFGWERAEKPAAWLVVAFPATIFWSAGLGRESIVAMLLALALLGAAWIRSGRITSGVLILAASTLLMVPFRGGLAFIGAMILPALVLLDAMFGKGIQMKTRILIPVATGLVLALALPLVSSVADRASYFDWDRQQTAAEGLNVGATSLDSAGQSADVPSEGLLGGVQSLPRTSFGPPPWWWSNFPLLITGLDGLMWFGLWILAFVGLRASPSKFSAALCMVPTVMLLVYIGTVGTNFGLVMRLRAHGVPLLAPVAGLGLAILLEARTRRKEESRMARKTRISHKDIPSAEHNSASQDTPASKGDEDGGLDRQRTLGELLETTEPARTFPMTGPAEAHHTPAPEIPPPA